ncbi:MAG: hypothetical protein K6T88_17940 [Bacillus sp. (in: Bacteria)]|nr:hypothetical protein [Bacillus sp. (in: firmicutes)]
MGIDKFSAALDLLIGYKVNLYVGEEVFYGKLIGVETDHVVLETERKYIFYYSIDKIQAITKNTKQFQPEKTMVPFQKTQSLTDLLQSFQHSWVTILSINKQKFSGVLSKIDTDFATLINGEDRILIKLTHISNILKGFIKEEKVKSEASKEEAKTKKDAEDKKTDCKEEATNSTKKTDKKTDVKSKEDNNHSEKKEDLVTKVEATEPNKTMVWSQPIKTEIIITESKNDISPNTNETKQTLSEETAAKSVPKASTETKRPNTEMITKDKKIEELKLSKPYPVEQPKDNKPIKAVVPILISENMPAPPLQMQKKDLKTQETPKVVKSVPSQNQVSKKPENIASSEANTKSVWKQKDQEMKAFRFSGEPVTRDGQRAFPFAGWPNRNNRTTRF